MLWSHLWSICTRKVWNSRSSLISAITQGKSHSWISTLPLAQMRISFWAETPKTALSNFRSKSRSTKDKSATKSARLSETLPRWKSQQSSSHLRSSIRYPRKIAKFFERLFRNLCKSGKRLCTRTSNRHHSTIWLAWALLRSTTLWSRSCLQSTASKSFRIASIFRSYNLRGLESNGF